ncbi:MAG: RNA polymerase sigma factor [Planctomycetales bacterium]
MARLGGSDEELVVRVGLGDLESLGELFLRHHHQILNFVHRMVGNQNAAEDITQQVFVRVLQYADKFKPEQSFRPWLFTVAANLCRDHFTKNGRRPTQELAVDPPGDLEDPLDQLVSAEECERVKQAVDELPEIYRSIIILRVYQQLPYAEIAAVLDILEGTARCRMEYALNRLRKALLNPRERESVDQTKTSEQKTSQSKAETDASE